MLLSDRWRSSREESRGREALAEDRHIQLVGDQAAEGAVEGAGENPPPKRNRDHLRLLVAGILVAGIRTLRFG